MTEGPILCCKKVAYQDELDANMTLRRILVHMRNDHRARKRPRVAYTCKEGRWHLSSWPDFSDEQAWEEGIRWIPIGSGDMTVAAAHVMKRDGYRCAFCLDPRQLKVRIRGEMASILNDVAGGPDMTEERRKIRRTTFSNLVTLCNKCDRFLGKERELGLRTGLVLDRDDDPRVRVAYWNRWWVYLNDDGSVTEWGAAPRTGETTR